MFTRNGFKKFAGGVILGVSTGIALSYPSETLVTWACAAVMALVLVVI